MELKARDYQVAGINEIRKLFTQGFTKVLLWLATGAGKTFVFCLMIKSAVEKGRKCIVVVRGRKLVDQASSRLFREGVPHGVMMAGHWNNRPHAKVQVCSIDTLISRGLKPEADLIIIDEAHMSSSKGYKEFLSQYGHETFVVAVTATPWVEKGLAHVAQEIVHPITMEQLVDENYLVPFRYYAPDTPDLSEVKVSSSTKDYVNSELADAMVKGQLTGSVVSHYKQLANGRKAILFAVNIRHSKIMAERFNGAGVPARHVDSDSTDEEREEAYKQLASGEIMVLCNVGVACTGVDIPPASAIIMARPTKSLNLFIQQAGRGTRLCPEEDKEDCILLDHAGNIDEHGFPTDEPEVNLNGWKKEGHKKLSKICKNCFAVYRSSRCPECGYTPPPAPTAEIEESDGTLKEIKKEEIDPIKLAHKQLLKEARKTKKKAAWAHYKLVDRFGYEAAKPYLPQWMVNQRENPFAMSPFKSF
jgi:superfamily II DNA or RNA helicase